MASEATVPQRKFSRYRSVRRAARALPETQPPIPSHSHESPRHNENVVLGNGSERQHVSRAPEAEDLARHSGGPDMRRVPVQEDENAQKKEEHLGRWAGKSDQVIDQDLGGSGSQENKSFNEIDPRRVIGPSRIKNEKAESRDMKHLDNESISATRSPTDRTGSRNPFRYFSKSRPMSRSMSRSSSPPKRNVDKSMNAQIPGESPRPQNMPKADRASTTTCIVEPRILVRYGETTVNLQISAQTTSIDLIRDVAQELKMSISPATTVAIERYIKLGLQRVIRPFERIQTIAHSWGSDTGNFIALQAFASADIHMQTPFLSEQPPATTINMYHSQEPGKWSKKRFSLSDGTIRSKSRSISHYIDLCHLSDYDIYTIDSTYLTSTLKPPRQYCYAVKSQQKLSVFQDTTSEFVHFFCSSDKDDAESWYGAVQRWRSWSLQASRPSSQEKLSFPDHDSIAKNPLNISHQTPHAGHVTRDHTSSTHQSKLAQGNGQQHSLDSSDDENRPRQIPLHLRMPPRDTPPSYEQAITTLPLDTKHREKHSARSDQKAQVEESSADSDGGLFAQTGLLGRSYTQRQKTLVQRDIRTSSADGPFTNDLGLLATAYAQKKQQAGGRPGTSGGRSIAESTFMNGSGPVRPTTSRSRQPEKDMRLGSSSSKQVSSSRPPTSDSANVHSDFTGLGRSSSVTRPRTTSSAVTRSTSTRRRDDAQRPPGLPAPLLDFDEGDTYVEVPQWRNRKTGKGVEAPAGMLLVDAASNPEVPGIEMPKRGVFRRAG